MSRESQDNNNNNNIDNTIQQEVLNDEAIAIELQAQEEAAAGAAAKPGQGPSTEVEVKSDDHRTYAQVIAGLPVPAVLAGTEPEAEKPLSKGRNARRKAQRRAKAAAKAEAAKTSPPNTQRQKNANNNNDPKPRPTTETTLTVGATTGQQDKDVALLTKEMLPANIAARNDEVKAASGVGIVRVKGTSNGFDAAKSKPTRIVKYILTIEQKKYVCNKIFPEFHVMFTDEETHGHPLLALERARAEELALEYTTRYECKKIVDVGGAAIRHKRKGRVDVHSCNPIVVPADVKRCYDRELASSGKLNACTLDVMSCINASSEEMPHGPFDAALFVHSVHYFNPPDVLAIMRKMNRKMAVIVSHDFSEYSGNLCLGEAQWKRVGDKLEKVEMVVVGGSSYHHDAPTWLKNAEVFVDGALIQLSPAKTVGSTQVILAFLSEKQLLQSPMPTQPTTLAGALAPEYNGPIDFRTFMRSGAALNATVGALFVPSRTYYSIGTKVIGFDAGHKILAVPKQAIPTIAMKITMRERTADLFQFCCQHAKAVLKASSMREDEMSTVLPFVAAAAFIYSLENELAAMEVIDNSNSLLQKLNNMLRFDFTKPWYQALTDAYGWVMGKRPPTIVEWDGQVASSGSSWSAFLRYAAYAVVVGTGMTFLARMSGPFGRPVPASPVGIFIARRDSVGQVLRRIASALYALVTQFLTRSVDCVKYVGESDAIVRSVCAWPRPLKEIHASAKVKWDPLLCGTCKPSFGNQLLGIGIASVKPTTFRSCYCNQVLAVINRGLLDRGDDKDHEKFWEMMTEWEIRYPTIRPCKVKAMCWKAFLMRYPKTKRDALERARKVFDSRNRADNITNKKSFIKVENAINVHERGPEFNISPLGETDYHDGPAVSDPRLIQGCLDEHKGRVGPWIVSFSKCLATEWCGNISGQRNNFYYTSGSDANAVGRWFNESRKISAAIVEWGRENGLDLVVVCDENDYERFDATTGVPSLNFSHRIYLRHGITRKANAGIIDQKKVHGCTNSGVVYSIDGTNASGGDDTSTGNTLRNKEVKHAVVNSTAVWSSHAFLGDDSAGFVVLNRDVVSVDKFAALQEFVARCLAGFRPEPCYMSDYRDMTFCSSYFWPAKVNGEETEILGPKIGRVLAKTFYSTKPLSRPKALGQVRGVCLGLQNDVRHIPVLRVLIPKLLELTEGATVRAPPREDHKFHVSTVAEMSDHIWEWVEHVYQLDATIFLDAEKVIKSIKRIPCIIDHPALDAIVMHDCPPKGAEPKRTSQIEIVPDEAETTRLYDLGEAVYDEILADPNEIKNTSNVPSYLDTDRQPAESLPNATLWSVAALVAAGVSMCARLPGYKSVSDWPVATEEAQRIAEYCGAVIWAPFIEEALKRMSWVAMVGIPLLEFWGDYQNALAAGATGMGWTNLIQPAITRMTHFGLANQPFVLGVASHALWNHNSQMLNAAIAAGHDGVTTFCYGVAGALLCWDLGWTVKAIRNRIRPAWVNWRSHKKVAVLAGLGVLCAGLSSYVAQPDWWYSLLTGVHSAVRVALGFTSPPGVEIGAML